MGKIESHSRSTLVNPNVIVNGRRTSMRLEPAMWEALGDICRREGKTVHEICSLVEERRAQSNLTAAMRVFILGYFRAALMEQAAGGDVAARRVAAAAAKSYRA